MAVLEKRTPSRSAPPHSHLRGRPRAWVLAAAADAAEAVMCLITAAIASRRVGRKQGTHAHSPPISCLGRSLDPPCLLCVVAMRRCELDARLQPSLLCLHRRAVSDAYSSLPPCSQAPATCRRLARPWLSEWPQRQRGAARAALLRSHGRVRLAHARGGRRGGECDDPGACADHRVLVAALRPSASGRQ